MQLFATIYADFDEKLKVIQSLKLWYILLLPSLHSENLSYVSNPQNTSQCFAEDLMSPRELGVILRCAEKWLSVANTTKRVSKMAQLLRLFQEME